MWPAACGAYWALSSRASARCEEQAQACPSVCVTVSFIMLGSQTTWSAPCQPSNAPYRRHHREHQQRLQKYTDSTNHGSAQHWLMINESKCFVGNLCPSQNIET